MTITVFYLIGCIITGYLYQKAANGKGSPLELGIAIALSWFGLALTAWAIVYQLFESEDGK